MTLGAGEEDPADGVGSRAHRAGGHVRGYLEVASEAVDGIPAALEYPGQPSKLLAGSRPTLRRP